MKKTMKILTVLCIVLMIVSISVVSYGSTADPAKTTLDALNGKAHVDAAGLQGFGNSVITVIRVVGMTIAVIILLVLGIKYMMGSAEEKADYKKSMIPYIVGAVLLFSATALVGFIYDIAYQFSSTGVTGGTGNGQ